MKNAIRTINTSLLLSMETLKKITGGREYGSPRGKDFAPITTSVENTVNGQISYEYCGDGGKNGGFYATWENPS